MTSIYPVRVFNILADFCVDHRESVEDTTREVAKWCLLANADQMSRKSLSDFSANWIKRVASKEDADGYTALMHVAACGAEFVLQMLLQFGFNEININQKSPSSRWTALHFAAYGGHIESMKILAQFACDIDPKTSGGETPLHLLHSRGEKVIGEWLKFKPNLNAKDNRGETLAHKVARWGDIASMRLIVQKGANMHADRPQDVFGNGFTLHLRPIHIAASRGHVQMIRFLRTNRQSDFDYSVWKRPTTWRDCFDRRFCSFALQLAIMNGHRHAAQSLLKSEETTAGTDVGSCIDVAGMYGRNALHLAVIFNRLQIMKDMHDHTFGIFDAFKFALKQKDNSGRTPRDYAQAHDRTEFLKFFNQHYPEEQA